MDLQMAFSRYAGAVKMEKLAAAEYKAAHDAEREAHARLEAAIIETSAASAALREVLWNPPPAFCERLR
jgi:hypothetical protein